MKLKKKHKKRGRPVTTRYRKLPQITVKFRNESEIFILKQGFSRFCQRYGLYNDTGQRRSLYEYCRDILLQKVREDFTKNGNH